MSKNIVGFLGGLDAIANFFKEKQEEDEEFSQYGDDESLYIKEERHYIHTEDDSIVKEMRGY